MQAISRTHISLFLLTAVAGVYGSTVGHEFVSYDDPRVIYGNQLVTAGLSFDGVAKVFSQSTFGAWYPLTTLTHMLAWEMFGNDPAGHHMVNVALHAANVLLLFALFARLTGRVWLAAIVATLFAIHPLHVESVAWVTERKDVLAGFFGFLCLHAYVRYTERPNAMRYTLVFLLFALGLMAKSMLVTLPFLLLLLDAWPLERTKGVHALVAGRLLLEKLPLLALSLAACIATYQANQQIDVLANPLEISPLWRLINTPISYVSYLGKGIWPVGLACHYPHPAFATPELLAQYGVGAAAASVGLLAVTGFAIRARRTRPWLLVGWVWYLGTLLPMIGIVQVGFAALADRFVYLPFVGIYWIVAEGILEAAARYSRARPALLACGIIGVLVLGGMAARQVVVWKDSRQLFEHALAVTERNAFAHSNLGAVRFSNGRIADAKQEFLAAIAIGPSIPEDHHNLGVALQALGELGPAVAAFRQALALAPKDFDINYQLGSTLFQLNHYGPAAKYFERALRVRPKSPQARHFLGEARRHARDQP